MRENWFWFNDEQWAKIKPHLPTNQRGPKRKEDRRILSGIMHVLKRGCRWVDGVGPRGWREQYALALLGLVSLIDLRAVSSSRPALAE
jgi:transposase